MCNDNQHFFSMHSSLTLEETVAYTSPELPTKLYNPRLLFSFFLNGDSSTKATPIKTCTQILLAVSINNEEKEVIPC